MNDLKVNENIYAVKNELPPESPQKMEALKDMQEENAALFKQYGMLSLIYGLFFSFCLYKADFGITYTLFVLGSLVFLGITEACTQNKSNYTWKDFLFGESGKFGIRSFYIISICLLGISMFLTNSYAINVMSCLGIFVLTGCLLYISYLGQSGDAPSKIALSIMKISFLPLIKLPTPFQGFSSYGASKKNDGSMEARKKINAILLGILVAIPVVFIIILLLANADIIFLRFIENFYIDISIARWVRHFIGFLVIALIGFISFYCIMASLRPEEETFSSIKTTSNKANPLIMIPMEIVLALIYLVFCAIQFVYLLGHATLPDGYTYANYAHEGFYQLLFVCLINIFISSLVKSKFERHTLLSILTLIICGCTYILIFSSAYRMILYVQAYSLTFLRFFVLWFLIVLAISLSILIAGIVKEKINIAKSCLIAGTILYIVFAFIRPDYIIADYNLRASGEVFYCYDTDYIIYNLSMDAVPALIKHGQSEIAQKKLDIYVNHYNNSSDFGYYDKESNVNALSKMLESFKHFNLSIYIAKRMVDV